MNARQAGDAGELTLRYTLTLRGPAAIDAAYLEAIEEDADERDTTPAQKIARYIGGPLSTYEQRIAEELPEGWRATIEEVLS